MSKVTYVIEDGILKLTDGKQSLELYLTQEVRQDLIIAMDGLNHPGENSAPNRVRKRKLFGRPIR
jgi:hypothetical protein